MQEVLSALPVDRFSFLLSLYLSHSLYTCTWGGSILHPHVPRIEPGIEPSNVAGTVANKSRSSWEIGWL